MCIALLLSATLSAQNLLENGGMSDSAYTFNYTTQTPAASQGGCLRITSPVLIQYPVLAKTIAQSRQILCGGWRVYLSTVAPSPNADYALNNITTRKFMKE